MEQVGRRYWAPRRYISLYEKATTARDYGQAVPVVVVTTLEYLQEHGGGAAVWRRLGRDGEQTLTAALDNAGAHAYYGLDAIPAHWTDPPHVPLPGFDGRVLDLTDLLHLAHRLLEAGRVRRPAVGGGSRSGRRP